MEDPVYIFFSKYAKKQNNLLAVKNLKTNPVKEYPEHKIGQRWCQELKSARKPLRLSFTAIWT